MSIKDNVSKQQRSKNVIIFGLVDDDNTNQNIWLSISKLFAGVKLEIPDVAIDDIYSLGKSPAKRQIIVKFIAMRWAKIVLAKKRDFKPFNIFISKDLTPSERAEMKSQLLTIKSLKDAGFKPTLKKGKIYLDNRELSNEEATSTSIPPWLAMFYQSINRRIR